MSSADSNRIVSGEGEASATDLHFWLDPIRYAAVGTALGERLARGCAERQVGCGGNVVCRAWRLLRDRLVDGGLEALEVGDERHLGPVSYTHLTLPTSDLV